MLSLPKILLLIVIGVAALYGTRLIGRMRSKASDAEGDGARGQSAGDAVRIEAVDLVQCEKCGRYIDPGIGNCDCQTTR